MENELFTWGVGLVAGFAVGLVGIGGGTLVMPYLVLYLKLPVLVAIGTDLVFAAVIKWIGAFKHTTQKTVDWGTTKSLLEGSVPAGLIATAILYALGHEDFGLHTSLLTTLVGIGLIVVAIVALIGHQRRHPNDDNPAILRRGGALVGTLVAWTSVGSGSLITALLMSRGRLSPERVVGTDLAHAVVASTLLALIHISQGGVLWSTAGGLILGGIPGVILGSRLTIRLPKPMLRGALASLLLISGTSLIFGR